MKINKLTVQNFKAISNETAKFNGCSAIVTAGNNLGKTSLLRGLIDRLRGEKPDIILKEGEENGMSIMELSDGSRIEWKFNKKSESFAYITKDGIKMTAGVIRAIGERYFGIKFDIDKFLNSAPKVQLKELQKIVGLDFSDIDIRYQTAYTDRTDKNREVARLRALNYAKPILIEKPDIESLKTKLNITRLKNEALKMAWVNENKIKMNYVFSFNNEQKTKTIKVDALKKTLTNIINILDIFQDCFDVEKAKAIINNLPQPEKELIFKESIEPKYISIIELEEKLNTATQQMREYDAYDRELHTYLKWTKECLKAKTQADKADEMVKSIEVEKRKMVYKADIPNEFKITDDGILYNNLPLTNSQISSSSKYIAALKIGLLGLGEVKTMHFDASCLDNKSLSEVQEWANENDLQLLIERPDLDGGNIKYQII